MKTDDIELDEELLARAKRALGARTIRATVEEALRRAAEEAEGDQARRAADQVRYLKRLHTRIDRQELASEGMWRQQAGFSTRAPRWADEPAEDLQGERPAPGPRAVVLAPP
ncbi:MAG TPA: type II toxin-antitoxin system VapB family antitoxin [Actinomycetota bacterium]|nr:type II toxin-antitoxin system VapB family antitoxin [Actinomycetota bacterium]